MPNGSTISSVILVGRRLTQAVGQAATQLLPVPLGSRTGVSVIGSRLGLPAVHLPRERSRSYRSAAALAARVASDHTALYGYSYLRALPCVREAPLSYARCPVLACADCRYADPAAPPNTCCSRPPCRGDFPFQYDAQWRLGPQRRTRRAAAERHRSAASSRYFLMLIHSDY
jgi:hypothetical protein